MMSVQALWCDSSKDNVWQYCGITVEGEVNNMISNSANLYHVTFAHTVTNYVEASLTSPGACNTFCKAMDGRCCSYTVMTANPAYTDSP